LRNTARGRTSTTASASGAAGDIDGPNRRSPRCNGHRGSARHAARQTRIAVAGQGRALRKQARCVGARTSRRFPRADLAGALALDCRNTDLDFEIDNGCLRPRVRHEVDCLRELTRKPVAPTRSVHSPQGGVLHDRVVADAKPLPHDDRDSGPGPVLTDLVCAYSPPWPVFHTGKPLKRFWVLGLAICREIVDGAGVVRSALRNRESAWRVGRSDLRLCDLPRRRECDQGRTPQTFLRGIKFFEELVTCTRSQAGLLVARSGRSRILWVRLSRRRPGNSTTSHDHGATADHPRVRRTSNTAPRFDQGPSPEFDQGHGVFCQTGTSSHASKTTCQQLKAAGRMK